MISGSAPLPARPRPSKSRTTRHPAPARAFLRLSFLLALAAAWPAAGLAQYMYLDSDGDGIHTAADQVNPSGVTTFDVWLSPDSNRDGTEVLCPYPGPSTPITVFSYVFLLRAVNGTVNWSGFINRLPDAAVSFGEFYNSTEYNNGRGSFMAQEGLTRLASLSVTVASGTPSIQIVDAPTTLNTPEPFTVFGTHCLNLTSLDYTWQLGVVWFDVDGLSFGTPTPAHAPVLAQPVAMTVPVGGVVRQALTATDPDGQPVTFSKAAGPDFFYVETLDPGRGSATGEALLTPIYSDVGQLSGTVEVTDGVDTDRKSFDITVTSVPNRAPVLLSSGPIQVVAGTVFRYALEAGDSDGQPVEFTLLSGPNWAEVSTMNAGRGTAVGSLRLTPTLCDVGAASAVISISDGIAADQRSLDIQVLAPRAAPETAVLPWFGGPGVALGDLDGDGHLDLVGGNREVTVSPGLGNGTFGPASQYSLAAHLVALAVGDVDGDGLLDVAAVTEGPSQLSILIGVGNGMLSDRRDYATGDTPQCVRLTDLNSDGNLDVIVANGYDDFVSVFLGNGDGAFSPRRDFHTLPGPIDLAIADFDRDGRLDLATANLGSASATLLFGRGDGTFGRGLDVATDRISFVVASDFDGDGILDLALGPASGGVAVLIGRGHGTFTPGTPVPLSHLGVGDAAATDWNADGNVDLVVVGDDSGFTILYGHGDGTFPARETFAGGYYWLALGDLNEDGFPDAVAGGAILLNQSSRLGAVKARAFARNEDRTVPIRPSGPDLCVRLEPVDGSYANGDVNLASVTLFSEGTGSVGRVTAVPGKTADEGDSDRNGIVEIPVCFASADLARLFDGVRGRRTISARLEGALSSGKRFCAPMEMTIVTTGKPLEITVRPNPLNPSSVLKFTTSGNGFLRVRLFDLHGRLVRTIADVPLAPAGAHEFPIDADDRQSGAIASGIYFLRVETPEGASRARVAVLK